MNLLLKILLSLYPFITANSGFHRYLASITSCSKGTSSAVHLSLSSTHAWMHNQTKINSIFEALILFMYTMTSSIFAYILKDMRPRLVKIVLTVNKINDVTCEQAPVLILTCICN